MIISASRRTDIPAFYSKWFMNRIKDGFVMVRNPINPNQISKVSLSPNVVDCIVFWTKNAKPMFQYLEELNRSYCYYFQYTLNGYDIDIEPNVEKLDSKIKTLKELSMKTSKQQVIWRYDPILLTDRYSLKWHIDTFEYIANQLSGYVETCVFSFLDLYDKIQKNMQNINGKCLSVEEMNFVAKEFSKICTKYNIALKTCCEEIDLDLYNVSHSCCIDPILIQKLIKCDLKFKKDSSQRPICGCIESIDIGQYNTCLHGCSYCYANYSIKSVLENFKRHNDNEPILVGQITEEKVVERKVKSNKDYQMKLF